MQEVVAALKQLLSVVPEDPTAPTPYGQRTRQLRADIEVALARLQVLAQCLDPVHRPTFVFDPSNPEFVGRLIGRTLVEQDRQPLASLAKFYGSGVYALYYRGPFPAYADIKGKETPIYVGKADPPAPDAKAPVEQGLKLWERLIRDHARSIRAASSTLDVSDFDCRVLVVQSGWQRAAEEYLIGVFKPVWNQDICYGFGKHGDRAETRSNTRSPWDTLHPGRGWATREANVPNLLSRKQIMEQIEQHFQQYPPLQQRTLW